MVGLVLLHGFGGAPSSWDTFRAHLAAQQVVWVPELVGHGIPCRAGLGFEDEVDRLLARLAAESRSRGVDRWWLVGYSMGGRLALGMLAAARSKMDAAGFELIGASLIGANPGLEGGAARRERRAADARWARLLEEEGVEAFLEAWRAQPLFASQARLDAERRSTQRRITRGHAPEELACAMRSLSLGSMPVFREVLAEIDCPVDWIVGELDSKFLELAEAAAARMSAARLVSVPDVGHNVLFEDPERLAQIVRAAVESAR